MSTTGDLPGLPPHDLDDDDDAVFDELARRAGAALRHPAPDNGVQTIAARHRRQQALKTSMVGGAAVAALIATLLVLSNRDDAQPLRPADSPATTPAVTNPTPATSPVTLSPSTSSSAAPTTVAPLIEQAPFTTPELFTEIAPGSMVELADAPIASRTLGAAVWTGTEMIVWGGTAYEPATDNWTNLADGAAFDLANGTWRVIAPSPLSGRRQSPAVWTGTEMIVWGGFIGDDRRIHDGAAYNPTNDTWRMLPPLPFRLEAGIRIVSMVWTGSEAVISGDMGAAAYDPDTDSWRRLTDEDVFGDPLWTGDSIIWRSPESLTRYDAAADTWTVVDNQYAELVGVPDPDGIISNFVALPKETGAPTQVLDDELEPIGELPAFPGQPSEFGDTLGASAKWVGGQVIFTIWAGEFPYEPEQRWTLDPTNQTWSQLDAAIPEPVVVAGDVMLAWGDQNGPGGEFGVAYRTGTR